MADNPPHPGPEPGPGADAHEWSVYAQANGKWSDWIKEHPEDAAQPAPPIVALAEPPPPDESTAPTTTKKGPAPKGQTGL